MRTKHPRFKRSNNWNGSILDVKPLTTFWYFHRLCLEQALAIFQLIGSKLFCFYLAMVVRPWRRMRLARQHFVSFQALLGCWLAAWHGAECSQPPAVFSFARGASKRYQSWQILWEQFWFIQLLDPATEEHPVPCNCGMAKCALIKALLDKEEEDMEDLEELPPQLVWDCAEEWINFWKRGLNETLLGFSQKSRVKGDCWEI